MRSSRITLYMTLAVVAGILILIGINAVNMLGISRGRYISPSEVRGMAVVHDNLLYTLNFEHQNTLVDIFNRAIPITHEAAKTRMKPLQEVPDVQKIIIYRFSASDIEITPAGYVSKIHSKGGSHSIERLNIIFSAPAWNSGGLLEEATQDQMQDLLSTTYDH